MNVTDYLDPLVIRMDKNFKHTKTPHSKTTKKSNGRKKETTKQAKHPSKRQDDLYSTHSPDLLKVISLT